MPNRSNSSQSIHASAAAFNTKAVLIIGAPNSGKSSLLLQLLTLGFDYISDDITLLSLHENELWAKSPPQAQGRFEMRQIGIFQTQKQTQSPLHLVIDLDTEPSARLPKRDNFEYLGQKITKINAKNVKNIAELIYLLFSNQVIDITPRDIER